MDDEGGREGTAVSMWNRLNTFLLIDCVMIPTVNAQKKKQHHMPHLTSPHLTSPHHTTYSYLAIASEFSHLPKKERWRGGPLLQHKHHGGLPADVRDPLQEGEGGL